MISYVEYPSSFAEFWRLNKRFYGSRRRPGQDVTEDYETVLRWMADCDALPGIRVGDFLYYAQTDRYERVTVVWPDCRVSAVNDGTGEFTIGSAGIDYVGSDSQHSFVPTATLSAHGERPGLAHFWPEWTTRAGDVAYIYLNFRVFAVLPVREAVSQ